MYGKKYKVPSPIPQGIRDEISRTGQSHSVGEQADSWNQGPGTPTLLVGRLFCPIGKKTFYPLKCFPTDLLNFRI